MRTRTSKFATAPFFFGAAIFGWGASLATGATTNDLKADWSDVNNPNGVWSYNQGATPLPHVSCGFLSCGAPFTCCVPAWSRANACSSNPGMIPAWWKVPACDFTNAYDLRAGDIAIHSRDDANGASNGEGNVTWTSTTNGFVSISGGIWDAATLGRGNHWGIYHNGTLLTQGDIFDGDPYNRATPFDFRAGSGGWQVLQNIFVNTGDVIKLLITKTSQYGDFAGVNLTVVLASEPIGGPALRLQLHPGILVYGTPGKTYRIEYITQAGDTNWTALAAVVLPSSPYLIFDPQPATAPARFYRVVEIP